MPYVKQPARRRSPVPDKNAPLEVVDPIWLVRAIALSLVGALICGYATLCLLYYQGAWQLILHPTHTIDQIPASVGLAFTDVRFDSSDTGQPRLTGWWIAAESPNGFGGRYAAFTVLYLHDGSGSLSNTVPMLARLHKAGLNVFAIDYRGFGASDASAHPSEFRMAQDAAAALEYLTSTRHVPIEHVIPYGVGLGASLASDLASAHSELPVVILDNPDPDPGSTARAQDPGSTARAQSARFIPTRLLMGHPFDISKSISGLKTPKLLIAGSPNSTSASRESGSLQSLFRHAASPSFAVILPSGNYDVNYETALSRFLDQYLPPTRR